MYFETPYPFAIVNGTLIESQGKVETELLNPILYEVIRVIDGRPLFYKEHMDRLSETANLTGISLGAALEQMKLSAEKLIAANNIIHDNIKLVAGTNGKELIWSWFGVKGFYPPQEWYEHGIKATLLKETRDNPNAKVIHEALASKVDALRAEGVIFEGLLVDQNDCVLEGSRSNLFFIKGQKLITARPETVLKGITRIKILKVLKANGIELEEREIHQSELNSFDGAFISGTSIDLLPIEAIDSIVYNTSQLPLMSQLLIWYREAMTVSLSNF